MKKLIKLVLLPVMMIALAGAAEPAEPYLIAMRTEFPAVGQTGYLEFYLTHLRQSEWTYIYVEIIYSYNERPVESTTHVYVQPGLFVTVPYTPTQPRQEISVSYLYPYSVSSYGFGGESNVICYAQGGRTYDYQISPDFSIAHRNYYWGYDNKKYLPARVAQFRLTRNKVAHLFDMKWLNYLGATELVADASMSINYLLGKVQVSNKIDLRLKWLSSNVYNYDFKYRTIFKDDGTVSSSAHNIKDGNTQIIKFPAGASQIKLELTLSNLFGRGDRLLLFVPLEVDQTVISRCGGDSSFCLHQLDQSPVEFTSSGTTYEV